MKVTFSFNFIQIYFNKNLICNLLIRKILNNYITIYLCQLYFRVREINSKFIKEFATSVLRILLSQTRQIPSAILVSNILMMNRYMSNRVCATVGPCLSRKYRITCVMKIRKFHIHTWVANTKILCEEDFSLPPREGVTALS